MHLLTQASLFWLVRVYWALQRAKYSQKYQVLSSGVCRSPTEFIELSQQVQWNHAHASVIHPDRNRV